MCDLIDNTSLIFTDDDTDTIVSNSICDDDTTTTTVLDGAVNLDDMSITNTHNSGTTINTGSSFLYNNTHISVSQNDLYPIDINTQSVVMAALFNYSDDKDDSKYSKIYLPEIKMTYINLTQMFFTGCGNNFSSQLLNTIWKGIKGLSLANYFIRIVEKTYKVNIEQISATTKIQLYKECAFTKITDKAFKIVALNRTELNNALGSIESRPDSLLCVNVIFHLYSESLQVGLKIILRIAIKDTPTHINGSVCDLDDLMFVLNK